MPPRNPIPGKGFHDGRGAPLGPGKQTLTSLIDADVTPPPSAVAPGKGGIVDKR